VSWLHAISCQGPDAGSGASRIAKRVMRSGCMRRSVGDHVAENLGERKSALGDVSASHPGDVASWVFLSVAAAGREEVRCREWAGRIHHVIATQSAASARPGLACLSVKHERAWPQVPCRHADMEGGAVGGDLLRAEQPEGKGVMSEALPQFVARRR